MDKTELGTKRQCLNCAVKFYDLGKTPIVCPKCETTLVPEPVLPVRGQKAPDPVKPVKVEPVAKPAAKPPAVAVVALEEAEEEVPSEDAADLEAAKEIEDIEENPKADNQEGDNTFLETDEEENSDVSGLIDGGISKPKQDG